MESAPDGGALLLAESFSEYSSESRVLWHFENLFRQLPRKSSSLVPIGDGLRLVSGSSRVASGGRVLTPTTPLSFLFCKYRLVLFLDLSPPSLAPRAAGNGALLYRESLLLAVERYLQTLLRPMAVGTRSTVFLPRLYVSVVAGGGGESDTAAALLCFLTRAVQSLVSSRVSPRLILSLSLSLSLSFSLRPSLPLVSRLTACARPPPDTVTRAGLQTCQ